MLSANQCSPTSSFVAVSIHFVFILSFCLWTLTVWGELHVEMKFILFIWHKREHVKWTLQFEKVSQNHRQFSNICRQCLQASCIMTYLERQQATSQVELIHASLCPTTPNHHHAARKTTTNLSMKSVIRCDDIWSIPLQTQTQTQTHDQWIEWILMSISYLFRFRFQFCHRQIANIPAAKPMESTAFHINYESFVCSVWWRRFVGVLLKKKF